MPPMNQPGSRPAPRSTVARKVAEVVLPCVPATTTGKRSGRHSHSSASGSEIVEIPCTRAAIASGFFAGIALPITTRSGRGSRFSAR